MNGSKERRRSKSGVEGKRSREGKKRISHERNSNLGEAYANTSMQRTLELTLRRR
jgi:hypothetical protein